MSRGTRIACRSTLYLLVLLLPIRRLLLPYDCTTSGWETTKRIKAEMRNLATALESHYVDNECYPPGCPYAGPVEVNGALTTPIAYLQEYPVPPLFGVIQERVVIQRTLRWALLGAFVLFGGVWSVLCARYARGYVASILWRGVVFWLLCAGPFLAIDYGNDYGAVGAVFLGLTSLPAAGWFWSAAWTWYSRNQRFVAAEVLLLCVVPVLFQVKVFTVFGAHWAERCAGARIVDEPKHYLYATDGQTRWVLQAAGPDRKIDLDLAALIAEGTEAFLSTIHPSLLEQYQYSPENGLISGGDLFRTGP